MNYSLATSTPLLLFSYMALFPNAVYSLHSLPLNLHGWAKLKKAIWPCKLMSLEVWSFHYELDLQFCLANIPCGSWIGHAQYSLRRYSKPILFSVMLSWSSCFYFTRNVKAISCEWARPVSNSQQECLRICIITRLFCLRFIITITFGPFSFCYSLKFNFILFSASFPLICKCLKALPS